MFIIISLSLQVGPVIIIIIIIIIIIVDYSTLLRFVIMMIRI